MQLEETTEVVPCFDSDYNNAICEIEIILMFSIKTMNLKITSVSGVCVYW